VSFFLHLTSHDQTKCQIRRQSTHPENRPEPCGCVSWIDFDRYVSSPVTLTSILVSTKKNPSCTTKNWTIHLRKTQLERCMSLSMRLIHPWNRSYHEIVEAATLNNIAPTANTEVYYQRGKKVNKVCAPHTTTRSRSTRPTAILVHVPTKGQIYSLNIVRDF
jgi:hypothetical protein